MVHNQGNVPLVPRAMTDVMANDRWPVLFPSFTMETDLQLGVDGVRYINFRENEAFVVDDLAWKQMEDDTAAATAMVWLVDGVTFT